MQPRKSKAAIPPGRDGIWAAIRQMREFRLADLERRCPVGYDALRGYLIALQKAGYVEVAPRKSIWPPAVFRLIRDCGVHAPQLDREGREKPANGRQRMWMAMKALKSFNYRDLSLAAQVSDADAKFFCVHLKYAGYLAVVKAGKAGAITGQTDTLKLRADRDTGPNPPQIRKDKSVYDRNLHKVVWTPDREGRAA